MMRKDNIHFIAVKCHRTRIPTSDEEMARIQKMALQVCTTVCISMGQSLNGRSTMPTSEVNTRTATVLGTSPVSFPATRKTASSGAPAYAIRRVEHIREREHFNTPGRGFNGYSDCYAGTCGGAT